MGLIQQQSKSYMLFYLLFGITNVLFLWYYLSNTIIVFTTPQQFPINSFMRFPLTLLIFPAEVFSIAFGLYFVYLLTTNHLSYPVKPSGQVHADVAIIIPVYNEPKAIIERTVRACSQLTWKRATTYILDDSTETERKQEVDELARKYKCKVIRRRDRVGYKAGNINNAVSHLKEDYFVVLDSDQAPLPEFLEETMPYFSEKDVGFVQTPQYYLNDGTPLERAAKMGTNIFFQAQCASKARDGALPFCGTNAVIRKKAFTDVKGFSYYTSTEDIELGLKFNSYGYRGVYVPHVLIHGYGPIDFPSYASQQYRWANGNLAILRERVLPLLKGNFSLRYQIHTFFTLGWWLNGLATLAFILVPLLSLAFGLGTHHAWLPTTLIILLYINVGLGITLVYLSLRGRHDKVSIKDALLQYSLITNSMFIFVRAAINVALKRYIGFERTNKSGTASGWRHIKWNLLLAALCYAASLYSLYLATISSDIIQLRSYLPISLWLLFYAIVLSSSIVFVGTTGPTFRRHHGRVRI